MASPKLHADDTPVPVLAPGTGKTSTGRLWVYLRDNRRWSPSDKPAARFRYSPDRKGERPREHLAAFAGFLQADAYAGFNPLYDPGRMPGVITPVACWAHARRKFFELHTANKSQLAEQALALIGQIYEAERQAQGVEADERLRIRQQQSRSAVDRLHLWLTEHRGKVPSGSATAKAMDYSLRRWPALTRLLEDGRIPIDNNWVENQIRPIAVGRSNWLFAGSLRAGKRAAAVMSLIHSARLNAWSRPRMRDQGGKDLDQHVRECGEW